MASIWSTMTSVTSTWHLWSVINIFDSNVCCCFLFLSSLFHCKITIQHELGGVKGKRFCHKARGLPKKLTIQRVGNWLFGLWVCLSYFFLKLQEVSQTISYRGTCLSLQTYICLLVIVT